MGTRATFFTRLGAKGEFSCRACGSPSISVPTPLAPNASVVCGRCSRPIATWSQFCRKVEQLLSTDNLPAASYPAAMSKPGLGNAAASGGQAP